MKYVLNPLAIYELGQRSNQEDSIFPVSGEVSAEDRLFIVCDGMVVMSRVRLPARQYAKR